MKNQKFAVDARTEWRRKAIAERIWIVIPTDGEAGSLNAVLTSYLEGVRPHDRIVVMANGDLDDTVPAIEAVCQEDTRVTVLVDRRHLGKGGALIAGLRYVARSADPEDIVCFV